MSTSPRTPSIDDLESDVWNLFHLLDALEDLIIERGSQKRIDALSWIARDLAKTLGHDTTALSSAAAKSRARSGGKA